MNNAIANQEFYSINSIFAEYDKIEEENVIILLRSALKTRLITDQHIQESQNFDNFWKQIARVFRYFNSEEKDLIAKCISKVSSWNYLTQKYMLNITEVYCENMEEDEIVSVSNDILHSILSSGIFNFEIKNDILKCLWLIKQIELDRIIYPEYYENNVFCFNKATLKTLLIQLKKSESRYLYWEYNSLFSSTFIGAIHTLIRNKKFLYLGSSDFPSSFFNSKLVQRIMINIHLESPLSDKNLALLISKIKPEFKFYGKEMNDFTRIVNDSSFEPYITGHYYVDGFGSIQMGDVINLPFAEVNLENEKQIDMLIKQLQNSRNEQEVDYFTYRNTEGQDLEFIKKLNNQATWNANSGLIQYLLLKLISKRNLRLQYASSIVSLLIFGMENGFLNAEIPLMYLKLRYRSKTNRDLKYLDEKLLSTVFKFLTNNEIDEVYNILFKVINPNKLDYPTIDISISGFCGMQRRIEILNSDLGRYYEVIKSISREKIDIYKKVIVDGIQSLSYPLNSYYSGYFVELIDFSENKVDSYAFIGYSHRFYGFDILRAEQFRESAIELLYSGCQDEYVIRNIADIISRFYKPDTLLFSCGNVTDTFSNQLLIQLHRLFCILDDLDRNHSSQWLIWFLDNCSVANTFCNQTLLHFADIEVERIQKLTVILEASRPIEGQKIREYSFNYIRSIDDFDEIRHNALLMFVATNYKKGLINVSHSFISAIEQIIKVLNNHSYTSIAHEYIELLRNKVPTYDIERLESIIDHKNSIK